MDRDGVINVDHGYVFKTEDFEFISDLFRVLRKLNEKGYLLIIITNQSGIGRGYYSEADFEFLTGWMLERFGEEGVEIAGVYHCPHDPAENCECRKPDPGMLVKAISAHKIDPSVSWMIGDKPSDMEAAAAAGIKNLVMVGERCSDLDVYKVSEIGELLDLPI